MKEKKQKKQIEVVVEGVVKTRKPRCLITEEIFDEIIEWVSCGNTLRSFCRQPNVPDWTTVYSYINNSEERADRFRKAREAGMDAIAEDTIHMVDEYPERIHDERVDPGWVNWRRIQVDQRLKLLAKWDPRRYGDRVNVDHAGGVSLNVVTGVPDEIINDAIKLPE
jgi:hypothetical protein